MAHRPRSRGAALGTASAAAPRTGSCQGSPSHHTERSALGNATGRLLRCSRVGQGRDCSPAAALERLVRVCGPGRCPAGEWGPPGGVCGAQGSRGKEVRKDRVPGVRGSRGSGVEGAPEGRGAQRAPQSSSPVPGVRGVPAVPGPQQRGGRRVTAVPRHPGAAPPLPASPCKKGVPLSPATAASPAPTRAPSPYRYAAISASSAIRSRSSAGYSRRHRAISCSASPICRSSSATRSCGRAVSATPGPRPGPRDPLPSPSRLPAPVVPRLRLHPHGSAPQIQTPRPHNQASPTPALSPSEPKRPLPFL